MNLLWLHWFPLCHLNLFFQQVISVHSICRIINYLSVRPNRRNKLRFNNVKRSFQKEWNPRKWVFLIRESISFELENDGKSWTRWRAFVLVHSHKNLMGKAGWVEFPASAWWVKFHACRSLDFIFIRNFSYHGLLKSRIIIQTLSLRLLKQTH